ncbi:MAG TPA: hypothetical protein VGS58_12765 [Candidatus Sulfopaludibacter sp.]|nr:hypothetical protein [Candidatus Sulfopaludibacter sp.]
MTISMLNRGFEGVTTLFAVFIVVRMRRGRLHGRYPFLFAYMLFLVPYTIIPMVMDLHSRAYFRFWLVSEPMNWTAEILLVRELCGLVLERYQGLCSLGRWAMYGGIAISAAISLASLMARVPAAALRRSPTLYYMLAADRGFHFAMGLFLLLMLLLASRYPVPLNRNILVNAALYTALFLCSTLAALLHSVFDVRVSQRVDAMLVGSAALSMLIWFFALTPAGEAVQVEMARLRPDHERRVLSHLEELNRLVLRLAAS